MKRLLLLFIAASLLTVSYAEKPFAEKKVILQYNFDDGTATDLSGRGYDGIIGSDGNVVASSETPLASGGSFAFTGDSTGHIYNDDVIAELNGLDAISVSVWVKADATDSDNGVIYCDSEQWNADRDITIRYDAGGWVSGGTNVIKAGMTIKGESSFMADDTCEVNIETNSDLQTTEWQHIVMAWESGDTTITLYVDGDPSLVAANGYGASSMVDNSNSYANGNYTLPSVAVIDDLNRFWIGKGPKNRGTGWTGLIDEVVVLNWKVSQAAVDSLAAGEVPPHGITSIRETVKINNLSVYPNPFNNNLHISFNSEVPSFVSLELYDICGKKVATLANDTYAAGLTTFNWNAEKLPAGVYLGRLSLDNTVQSFKLIKE